ncbi:MAG: hypothetical protein ABIE74_00435 [Pseudomonadota bacterium]
MISLNLLRNLSKSPVSLVSESRIPPDPISQSSAIDGLENVVNGGISGVDVNSTSIAQGSMLLQWGGEGRISFRQYQRSLILSKRANELFQIKSIFEALENPNLINLFKYIIEEADAVEILENTRKITGSMQVLLDVDNDTHFTLMVFDTPLSFVRVRDEIYILEDGERPYNCIGLDRLRSILNQKSVSALSEGFLHGVRESFVNLESRIDAATFLALRGDPEALRMLYSCFNIESDFGDRRVVSRLKKAVQAVSAVGDIKFRPRLEKLLKSCFAVMDQNREAYEHDENELVRTLETHVPVQMSAEHELYARGFLLADEIVKALGYLGDYRAGDILLRGLDNPDPRIVTSCIDSLGKLGDESVLDVESLSFIEDAQYIITGDGINVIDARLKLGAILTEQMKQTLSVIHHRAYAEEPIKKRAKRLLQLRGIDFSEYNSNLPYFDDIVMHHARNAETRRSALDFYIKSSVDFRRYSAFLAVSEYGDPSFEKDLLKALLDEHKKSKPLLITAIEMCGCSSAYEHLMSLLNDDDSINSKSATSALASLGFVNELINLYMLERSKSGYLAEIGRGLAMKAVIISFLGGFNQAIGNVVGDWQAETEAEEIEDLSQS